MDLPSVGRALLLVHPDTDAMATARILSYMLRADGVPYQLRPCLGWERLKRILGRVGVLPLASDTAGGVDEGDETDNEDEDGNANGNNGGAAHWVENDTDIRAVVLMNMGANRNLAKLFRQQQQSAMTRDSHGMSGPINMGGGNKNVKCYVFDCHRPYHLANIHTGKNVVLFNDRPFEEEEIPSDGDNLSGDESSSSSSSEGGSSSSGGDSDSDEGEQEFKDEGEQEFEMGGNDGEF